MLVIIVFMYTTLAILVLSTIPYKYDRFKKSDAELAKEKSKKLAKK